ncbi:FAD-dependent monooxygenase [Actinokineospora sp. NBRC 105648]|uniref:FAD-dependent monooxygenase n=1 Tax=Actinokineospora sp. NBRC 105648 TaxID=3032206 RepID=UPI00249FF76C|nr:FAD-dependent monooxygenase [Actinokineospora sp. NBRC 105648]GLZ36588.1 FAD-dependent oxidoreductase [Actinokineospora sp. NBRC 105648]
MTTDDVQGSTGQGSADRVEVAIVGGGPVGMLLAGELALHGVGVLVLERLPRPTGESKAGTLHSRTAETLHRRGLLAAVQPGRPAPAGSRGPVPFHFAGMFELDLARVVDEGPVLVGSPQAYAEQVFADRAVALGARIERDSEVVGLTERGDGVELEVRSSTGTTRRVTAGWCVGCDGARSAVRKLAGIPFVGTPATISALMGDVRLLDPYSAPHGWQRNERGWTLFWTNPGGHSRVCSYDFTAPHPDRGAPVTLAELRGEIERIAGVPVPMDSPRWLTRFSDAALLAEPYRRGRVLLAGDAAHVHFPMGGQGVNLGLQDAVNLGWKLAGEVAGWAPPELLDTYHGERAPVAARVLYNVRAQVGLMLPDHRVDPLRELFAELMHLPQVNDFLSRMISGQDVRYDTGDRADPLVGLLAPDLRLKVGSELVSVAELLRAGRPVLFDFAGPSPLGELAAGWADRVDVVVATCEEVVAAPALLVRPDGYIAWSGRGLDSDRHTLDVALRAWFGCPKA